MEKETKGASKLHLIKKAITPLSSIESVSLQAGKVAEAFPTFDYWCKVSAYDFCPSWKVSCYQACASWPV